MIKIPCFGKVMRVGLKEVEYVQGGMGVFLFDENMEIVTNLSIRLDTKPPKGAMWMKTWSENEEIYKWLVKDGYLEETGEFCKTGFCQSPACRLTEKAKKILEPV